MPQAPKQPSPGWLSWLWPRSAPKQRAPRSRGHGFLAGYSDGIQAAKRDRLTEDWSPQSLSPTSLHRFDNNLLLRRARDLVENNPYALSGIESYVANVVGTGITPKPLLDTAGQRKKWVDAWNWWGGEHQNEADLTGGQHIYELMALWLTEVIVGGGCLVRYVSLDPDQYRDQRVKLALELIPEERFADEKDDLGGWFASVNRKKSGNPSAAASNSTPPPAAMSPIGSVPRIRATPARPGSRSGSPPRTAFIRFFASAWASIRGFTLLKAVVRWLWSLGYYFDNELMASAIKSCFAALIKTDAEDSEFTGLDDDSQAPSLPTSTATRSRSSSRESSAECEGKDATVTGIGPNTPTSSQEAWILLIERSIAVGMGLSYEALTRDYSRGSFSSMRAGLNEDRKRYRPMQASSSITFAGRPTSASLKRRLQAGTRRLPAAERARRQL
jgi:capsid protein